MDSRKTVSGFLAAFRVWGIKALAPCWVTWWERIGEFIERHSLSEKPDRLTWPAPLLAEDLPLGRGLF